MQRLEREKVLYEISMAIGNTLDIERMSREVLSTLLQKLSATTAAIFRQNETISFDDLLFSIPRRIRKNSGYLEALKVLNASEIPSSTVHGGKVCYFFTLHNFGYLLLFSDHEIEPLILKSLEPLFEKVATALIACENHRRLKESLSAAEAAGKAKMEFLANMSHEIRTPLNGILGFKDLLKKTALDSKQEKYLAIIESSTDSLLHIVNDILDFSKIESKKMTAEYIDSHIVDELRSSFLLYKAKAKEKQIEYVMTFDENIFSCLKVDLQHLKQVMTNLLSNAIKFTPEKGRIRIELTLLQDHEQRQKLYVAVHDTGIGITPELQATIFEPFMQADSSTTRKFGGTGLGLSISAAMLEIMGSKLQIQSTPHEGSTFFFELDLLKCHTRVPDKPEDEPTTLPSQQINLMVLVAEDNQTNQLLIATLLKSYGIGYELVANGKEAVEKIRAGRHYDLIFMDIHMPVMNGLEATNILRYELGCKVPVVALTANALEGDRQRFLDAGMDDYLAKPLDVNQLETILKHYAKGPVQDESSAADSSNILGALRAALPLPEATLLKLIQTFMRSTPSFIDKLQEAIAHQDYHAIATAAHSIRGSSSTLRFDAMFQIASEIEDHANEAAAFDYKGACRSIQSLMQDLSTRYG